VAAALADTIGAVVVTRDYLDLKLGEALAEATAETLKWMIGTIGFQTVVVLGGIAALFRLLH
jgi:hypothetical protein